jgi:hypothetical protein
VITHASSLLAESLTKLGQARRILPGNPQDVTFEHSPAPIEVYRRRLELSQALVTVEAAIALRDEPYAGSSKAVRLEGLRDDLRVALWLTENLLAKR